MSYSTRLAGLLLAATLLAASAPRGHWHRSDGHTTDARAVAEALRACEATSGGQASAERAVAACMARRGYFSWDGT